MSYQDPYQPQYGQQPQQPGQPGQPPIDQPYSGGPSYPVTPGPADYTGYPAPQSGPPGYGPAQPQSAPPGYGVQPAYGQPVYAQPVVAVVATPTNTMAILSLVMSLIGLSPLGVIFGHMARAQIKRTGEQGDGLALAGMIIGYIGTASYLSCLCIFVILPIIGIGILGAGAASSSNGYFLHTLTALLGLG